MRRKMMSRRARHVVGANTTEGQSLFTENTASGKLSFTDRRFNTMFSLVPEASIQPWTDLPLVFSASYDNTVLNLGTNAQLRFEVIVTFGNHPLGGPNHTDENVDINGNGVIDADEHKVRSIIALFEQDGAGTRSNANATLALSDTHPQTSRRPARSRSRTRRSTSAPRPGTVKVSYDPGTNGGSVTNCVHGTGTWRQSDGRLVLVRRRRTVAAADLHHGDDRATGLYTSGTVGCGWHDGDVYLVRSRRVGWDAGAEHRCRSSLLTSTTRSTAVHFAAIAAISASLPGTGPTYHAEFDQQDADLAHVPATQFGNACRAQRQTWSNHARSTLVRHLWRSGRRACTSTSTSPTPANQLSGTATAVKFGDFAPVRSSPRRPRLNGSTTRQLRRRSWIRPWAVVQTPYAIADLSALVTTGQRCLPGRLRERRSLRQHVVNGTCP